MQERENPHLLRNYLQEVLEVLNQDYPDNELQEAINSREVNWQELAINCQVLADLVPVQELLAIIEAQFKRDVDYLSKRTSSHLRWVHSEKTKNKIREGQYKQKVAPTVNRFQKRLDTHASKVVEIKKIRQNLNQLINQRRKEQILEIETSKVEEVA